MANWPASNRATGFMPDATAWNALAAMGPTWGGDLDVNANQRALTNLRGITMQSGKFLNGAGCVLMVHDAAGNWTVYAPDGSLVSTSGTTTSGLQEAINYATGNSYPLQVMGADNGSGVKAVIQCTSTVVFPATLSWYCGILCAVLNFTSAGANPCLTIDSTMNSRYDFSGTQVVNSGTGPNLIVAPVNPVPADGRKAITACRMILGSQVNIHSSGGGALDLTPLVEFDTSSWPVVDASFEWDELNGAGTSILVGNPGATSAFARNRLKCNSIHSQAGTSYSVIQVGTGSANAANINENNFDLDSVQINTASKRGYDVWGTYNRVNGSIFQAGVSADFCVVFESSSDFNQLQAGRLSGAAGPTADLSVVGTANHNKVTLQRNKVVQTVTVGSSPFTYHNTDFVEEAVGITGGTATLIEMSPDGSNWMTVGTTGYSGTLDAGDYIRITHSGAPTMKKIL